MHAMPRIRKTRVAADCPCAHNSAPRCHHAVSCASSSQAVNRVREHARHKVTTRGTATPTCMPEVWCMSRLLGLGGPSPAAARMAVAMVWNCSHPAHMHQPGCISLHASTCMHPLPAPPYVHHPARTSLHAPLCPHHQSCRPLPTRPVCLCPGCLARPRRVWLVAATPWLWP